jgi:serine O-acetyltransferase
LIASDVRAKAKWCYGAVTRRTMLKALCTDGTAAMIVYRFMQASQRRGLTPLAMAFNKLNGVANRCIIGRGAEFGPGFVLVHCLGVVINTSVRGGRDVKIEHLVTIGAEKGAAPVLGDDVFVGAGAKIVGAARIGSGVRIGANAVVLDDVPDGATAVGVPARIVNRGGATGAEPRSEAAR